MEPIISWDAPEHQHTEKNSDWHWAVGIVAFTGAALAFMFGQVIFGVLIVVSAVALVLHATTAARIVHCEINDRGVVIDRTLYPFLSLESFWIDPHRDPAKLLIKSQKAFMPYVSIRIPEEVNPEGVRDILLRYIAETEHDEPLTLRLMEALGF